MIRQIFKKPDYHLIERTLRSGSNYIKLDEDISTFIERDFYNMREDFIDIIQEHILRNRI